MRRYTEAEKRAAVARLNGDNHATVYRELGIPQATFQRWVTMYKPKRRNNRLPAFANARKPGPRARTQFWQADKGPPICGKCAHQLTLTTDGNGYLVKYCPWGCHE